ncbi:MAG: hypothetical protein HKN82_15390 [Akkermansiaceae bacterium]|nr:hypothetical protein [Akkermansiaceae bacterium]NNM29489.1 hypothetical protein [Akkermansiaceae bacterium]
MKEREKIIISGLVLFMMLIWLGFLLHANPDFPGSGWGLFFGIAGAALMLVPLLYLIIKRIKPLKRFVTRRVPMRTLLTVHIYAGVLGPILVVIHTGHKFESPIGIALTALTMIVVLSGFVGRYLMSSISREIREKKSTLKELRTDYDLVVARLGAEGGAGFFGSPGMLRSFLLRLVEPVLEHGPHAAEAQAIRLSESIADVEFALRTHETFKRAFSKWLKIHIAISVFLYLLLALHVYSELHYGLRWLS